MSLTATDIGLLYDRLSNEMLAFFVRRTLVPEVGMELLAETFAAAFVARDGCRARDDDARRAWLYGIARNLLIDYIRRGRVERDALRRIGVEPPQFTDAEYDRVEDLLSAETLHDAASFELMALPPEQREALQLRVIEERPYSSVARSLGVSEQTARARVSRALRTLRQSPTLDQLGKAADHA